MDVLKHTAPWVDWKQVQTVNGLENVITTDSGRGASVGEFTLPGFAFSILDAGQYIEILGSPHIWTITNADYDSNEDVTRYTIMDVFCHALQNRVLQRDLYVSQYNIDDRINTVIEEVNNHALSFNGFEITSYINGTASLRVPESSFSETSSAGSTVLDIIYRILESTSLCMVVYTSTHAKAATNIKVRIVYSNTEEPLPLPDGKITISRAPYLKHDRICVLTGRTYDFSYTTTDDKETSGTGPEMGDLSFETATLSNVIGDLVTNVVSGTDEWNRNNLIVSPSVITSLLSFNGAIQDPGVQIFNHRLWVPATVSFGTAAASVKNGILIPYFGDTLNSIISDESVYTPDGVYEVNNGFSGISCLGFRPEFNDKYMVSRETKVILSDTNPNFQVRTEAGTFPLSYFCNLTFGANHPSKVALVGIASLDTSEYVFFPLTGSTDKDIPYGFNTADVAVKKTPMLYPLDLWRLIYASVKTVSNAMADNYSRNTSKATVDVEELNVNNFNDDAAKRITVGTLLASVMGDRFRITAINTSFNEDGTPKRDIELIEV